MKTKRQWTDFLGQTFPSFKEMAAYWGLPPARVSSRLSKNWTLKDALMKPLHGCVLRIPDPETGEILTQKEYARRVGLSQATFRMRKKQGASKDLIFEPVRQNCIPAQDHTGRRFDSMSDMCAFWGIKPNVFHGRFTYLGWSLEAALTTPVRRIQRRNHE